MKKAAGTERHPSSTISVLSIGSTEEDHAALSWIFDSARWSGSPGAKWTFLGKPSEFSIWDFLTEKTQDAFSSV